MSDSAYPTREAITKIAALSYVVTRSTYVVADSDTAPEAAGRVALAVFVEMPLFVIAVAVSVNVLILNYLLPKIFVAMSRNSDR